MTWVRRKVVEVEAERESARSLAARLKLAPKRERKKGPSVAVVQKLEEEAKQVVEAGDWGALEPKHFAAIFSALHRSCYGVDDAQLSDGGLEFLGAASAAAKMIRTQFDEDKCAFAAYVRWAWRREHDTEQWRRQNAVNGKSIGWRQMFMPTGLLTRYRIERERARTNGKA